LPQLIHAKRPVKVSRFRSPKGRATPSLATLP
jgi:hypothetical protein